MTFPTPLRDARSNRASGTGSASSGTITREANAILSGVPAWWAGRARGAGLSGRWLDVSWAVDFEFPAWLGETAPMDLEGNAEDIGLAYVAALDPGDRAQHGRHYTPKDLATELWAMSKRAMGWKRPQPLSGLIQDPACGSGALLLPVLREHLGAAARIDPQLALAALPNLISGIDNDEGAVWLANVLLASEMLPILARTERARRRPLPALVTLGDGLAERNARARVITMNPPYGRVRLGAEERERFADSLYGHANLYGLFMAASLDALTDDGILAALVPTSFLSGRYFENLRRRVVEVAPLREIQFVADRSGAFEGVLQETCLATFTRKRARRVAVSNINGHVTDIANLASPRAITPWVLPRRSDDAPVAAAAIGMPNTLASAGWRVSTGPLVWNRRKSDLSAQDGPGRVPVVWAADIDEGKVHRDVARDVFRYLTLRGSDDRVLVLDEPAVLVQRTTAPEQQRRLVGAHLTGRILKEWGGRVVVENHVNVLRPAEAPGILPAETLARLLATDTVDRVLRCLSGSVALSAYELESLPLPDTDVITHWTELGGKEFDRAVARAYRPLTR